MKKILITGSAGFIGFSLSQKLCEMGFQVFGLDNINNYYDTNLKTNRLKILIENKNFVFEKIDIVDTSNLDKFLEKIQPELIVHLAAQAGVRYSIENPYAYVESNLVGFMNILEASKNYNIKHLIYASSSSVYGANTKIPFCESDNVDNPVSLYAATKKSNELLAHSYSHLYNLPTTGLRFFTVYGPFGRPDMAYFKFVRSILEDKTIDIYNKGDMKRDFTYIEDIIESIVRILDKIPSKKTELNQYNNNVIKSSAPYAIYNIGNNKPVELLYFIETIEKITSKKAKKNFCEMQLGDVKETYANIDNLISLINYQPQISIEKGLEYFIAWYKKYYNV